MEPPLGCHAIGVLEHPDLVEVAGIVAFDPVWDRPPLAAERKLVDRAWSKSRTVFADYSPYPSIVQAADGSIVASWFEKVNDGTAIGFARFNWAWLTAGK